MARAPAHCARARTAAHSLVRPRLKGRGARAPPRLRARKPFAHARAVLLLRRLRGRVYMLRLLRTS